MKIGYEAKRVFHNNTGLGNYSRYLIGIMSSFYPDNLYFLYNPKKSNKVLFEANNEIIFEKNPNTFLEKKFNSFWRQKCVTKDLAKDKIEIFHGLSGEIPIGLKKAKIKSVVTIHDLIFMRYPHLYSYFDRKIHYLKFKKAAHNSDIIIAISEQTKRDIITYLDVKPEKIRVIYQGCRAVFKQSYSELEKKTVADKYNLPKSFILNVGTIEERKNALTIVKSIKDIDTKLVLVGKETIYSKKIRKYITENSLEEKVIFLNGITEVELAIIYKLATIFVYLSIFEGFGIPIIEALYSKIPVVTNKNGVFPEAGGKDSIYIEPLCVNETKAAITTLLNNENLRNDIAAKGYEFVQKFNDEVIAKQLEQVYKELILL